MVSSRLAHLPERIEDPAAWNAAELNADARWICTLTPEEAGEVREAEASVARRGLRGAEFRREDFPLPGLAPKLAQILQELQHGRGAVVIRGLPVSPQEEEGAARIIWGITSHLGRQMKQSPGVNLGRFRDNLISHIVDQRLDPGDRNVHGSATGEEQQPHCDPSDLVALLCVRPSVNGGGISRVVSALSVYNEIRRQAPDAVETLFEGFYNDLRNEGSHGRGITEHRIPVFGYEQGHLSVSFNSKTIVLAAERQGKPLSAKDQRALDLMLETASRPDLVHQMAMQTGDLQLLNNYTMLHCRTAWVDPPDIARRRCMLRVWVRTDEPRPLPPGFAGGYLSGVTYDVGVQARELPGS